MLTFRYVSAILIGYLLGAIPVGYLAGKARDIDVRKYGSGHTGGTNVLRSAGPLPALLTVLGDVLKGMAAVLIARAILPTPIAEALAGLGAVAGHNWSAFIGFRGGVGTMTALGALFILSPKALVIVAPLGIIAALASGYASVGSLTVSFTVPLVLLCLTVVSSQPPAHLLYGVGVAAMIALSLRGNIQRLRAGTEHRIREKARRRE